MSKFGKCEICGRDGKLVRQELIPYNPILKEAAWVFRYYLCQWHRANGTKRGLSFEPMEFISDEVIKGASHE